MIVHGRRYIVHFNSTTGEGDCVNIARCMKWVAIMFVVQLTAQLGRVTV